MAVHQQVHLRKLMHCHRSAWAGIGGHGEERAGPAPDCIPYAPKVRPWPLFRLSAALPCWAALQGGVDLGRIASLEKEHKPVDTARKGDAVAMKIEVGWAEKAAALCMPSWRFFQRAQLPSSQPCLPQRASPICWSGGTQPLLLCLPFRAARCGCPLPFCRPPSRRRPRARTSATLTSRTSSTLASRELYAWELGAWGQVTAVPGAKRLLLTAPL